METRNWSKKLRLGNYIMDSPVNGDEPLEIEAIYSNLVIHGDRHIYNDELRPIPITDEWLYKFGFKRGGYDMIEVWHPDKPRFVMVGYLDNEEDNDYMGWNYNREGTTEEEYGSSRIEIRYVHQLQNLYFALTGEELEINLTKQT